MHLPLKADEQTDGIAMTFLYPCTYIYADMDRTSVSRTCDYDDANGSFCSVSPSVQSVSSVVEISHDFEGNIERSETLSNDGVTTTYNYDYMGRRFQKVEAGVGDPCAVTLQEAGVIGGFLCVIEGGAGSPSTPYFPVTNTNGNITDYINTNGSDATHYDYSTFGRAVLATGSSPDDSKFRFSTKYFDAETGLYYYGLRYYNSAIGRWPSRDPIEERGGLMLYGFVGNEPVGRWDLLGQVVEVRTGSMTVRRGGRVVLDEITVSLNLKMYFDCIPESIKERWKEGIKRKWRGKVGKYHLRTTVEEMTGAKKDMERRLDVNLIYMKEAGFRSLVQGSRIGWWAEDASKNAAAHEAGHLMGLEDRYYIWEVLRDPFSPVGEPPSFDDDLYREVYFVGEGTWQVHEEKEQGWHESVMFDEANPPIEIDVEDILKNNRGN